MLFVHIAQFTTFVYVYFDSFVLLIGLRRGFGHRHTEFDLTEHDQTNPGVVFAMRFGAVVNAETFKWGRLHMSGGNDGKGNREASSLGFG